MFYDTTYLLKDSVGNNALSYEKRTSPALTIPKRTFGTLHDVKTGDEIVFEELEGSLLHQCVGLENFVTLTDKNIPTTVFDNHNHALAFWYESYLHGTLRKGATLIHIDEHSDLWENPYDINICNNPDFFSQSPTDQLDHIYRFTNFSCNVGNYIQPAIRDGLIDTVIRIENEYQLDMYMNLSCEENTILNIDLDFFSSDMDFIDLHKKLQCIRNMLGQVSCITIATSPFFIEPRRAIEALHTIYQDI